MSLYRLAVRNGLLVREKRKLLRFWMWSFNRSEEDYLNKLKNRLTQLRQEQSLLTQSIPEVEKRIKDAKESLLQRGDGGTGPVFRDSWTPRREPVLLKKDVKLAAPKKKDPPKKEAAKPLLHITPAQ